MDDDVYKVLTPDLYRTNLFRILGFERNRKRVHIGKFFKQNTFAFHHRQASFRANITQAQHGAAIGYHCDQIIFPRQGIYFFWIVHNRPARFGHARSIGQA